MDSNGNRSSKGAKAAFWSLGILIFLFFCGLAAFPHWLSTSYGKNWALTTINNRIDGTLSIDQLTLRWWGGQSIQGLALKDEGGKEIFTFHSFKSDATLFSLLVGPIFNSYRLGKAVLDQPHLLLVKNQEGDLNIDQALSKKRKKKSISQTKHETEFPSLHGDIIVSDGQIMVSSPKIDPITISGLTIEMIESQDIFRVVGKTKQGIVEGDILASGTFNDQIHLLLNIQQFPLAILDQWWETALFTEGLGNSLTLDLELIKTKQTISLTSTIETSNLKGAFKGATNDNRFVLEPGGAITFTITPPFFKQLIEQSAQEKWRLASKADVLLTIEQLEFPFALNKIHWKEILFSGVISLERAEIVHDQLGHFSINHFVALLKSSDELQITYTGQIQSAVATQIKGSFSIDNQKKASYQANWTGFPIALFQLVSDEAIYLDGWVGPTMDLGVLGTYDQGAVDAEVAIAAPQFLLQGTITGKELANLSVDLTGSLLYSQRYKAILGPAPEMTIHADTSLEGNTFTIPFIRTITQNPYWKLNVEGTLGKKGEPFRLDLVKLEADGSISNLPVQEGEIIVNDGQIVVHIDGAKERIDGEAALETTLRGHLETRSLEAQGTIQNFVTEGKLDLKKAEISAKGNFDAFPVALLNPFFGEQINLVTFVGPSLDLRFDGKYAPSKTEKVTLDLEAQGQDFQTALSIAFDGTVTISQQKPSFLHWELTPVRYQTLMRLLRPHQEPDYVLTRGAPVDLLIHQFNCPVNAPSTIPSFLCQSGFSGEIKVGALHFKSRKTPEEIALLDITGSIQGENFSEAVRLFTKGKMVSPTIPKGKEAGFSFSGEMLGFWTHQGTFNSHGTVKGDLSVDLLPVKELTGILPLNDENRQWIQALLGPLVNARVHGQISQLTGPLTIDIKSSNLKAILPVRLGEGRITLDKAVEVELTLTESINEIFLKDVNPLMITGAWSEHPIRVFIDSEGFSIPFRPFSLRGINVQNAAIDFGKIRVRNGGQIQTLMEFLKAQEVSKEGLMDAWFTPIYMSLVDGVASYQRFDMLLGGNVHIAMWGRIDLNKDKVRMTLGISPTTLQQRFNISGISKKDMFQVKMRGSTSKLELDWSSATTRLGIIIAKNAAGGLGALIGGIIEQIIGNLGEEETPPPTTNPLPWERY